MGSETQTQVINTSQKGTPAGVVIFARTVLTADGELVEMSEEKQRPVIATLKEAGELKRPEEVISLPAAADSLEKKMAGMAEKSQREKSMLTPEADARAEQEAAAKAQQEAAARAEQEAAARAEQEAAARAKQEAAARAEQEAAARTQQETQQ